MEAGLLRAQAKESVVCKGVLGTFAPDRPPGGHPWPGTYGPAKNMLTRRLHAYRSIVLLLFLQKQNLATAIYLFGLGTLLTGLGLKHMRIRSHHDLAGALVTSLFLGRLVYPVSLIHI